MRNFRINFAFILLFLGLSISGKSQSGGRYETDFLTPDFHKGRREALRQFLPEHTVAILFSNPERNRSNDNDYPYHQDPDFYYLTGFNEPNAVLIISSEKISCNESESDEFLFIPKRDPKKETWTGKMADEKYASEISGIKTVYPTSAFDPLFVFPPKFSIWYLPLPEGVTDDKTSDADLFNLIEQFKRKSNFPPENGDSYKLRKALSTLREIKSEEELVLLRKTINISADGHLSMMKSIHPSMREYQLQAVGEFEFAKAGAESVGYASICGSGENSCILHYSTNRRMMNDSDLVVIDMGAEYHGYSGDITRTLPVSGKFTENQLILYNLVLEAQKAGIKECKAGNPFQAPHEAAKKVISEGLLKLGIISRADDYRMYFMHGTSHYLGLDVHDKGTYGALKPGNVITVEPGIYIPAGSECDPKWWNFGIRIEDDILITSSGCENLSIKVPSDPAEIERLIGASGNMHK